LYPVHKETPYRHPSLVVTGYDCRVFGAVHAGSKNFVSCLPRPETDAQTVGNPRLFGKFAFVSLGIHGSTYAQEANATFVSWFVCFLIHSAALSNSRALFACFKFGVLASHHSESFARLLCNYGAYSSAREHQSFHAQEQAMVLLNQALCDERFRL